jgi:ribosomal protein S18 acetylase RimI-like enzyme
LGPLVALWQACGLTRPWNDPAADIAFCLGAPQAALLVGCDEPSGELIGSVMVGHDGHRGWVYYLAVAPERWKEGWGARLMERAEAWLKERGVPKAQLMVRSSNTAAVGFYERIGYRAESVATLSKWLRPPPVEPDGS